MNQVAIVDKLLNGKRNGFYIDCGAADGVGLSNTLFFNQHRGWHGLLIEANPNLFRNIEKRRIKDYRVKIFLNKFGLLMWLKENNFIDKSRRLMSVIYHTVLQLNSCLSPNGKEEELTLQFGGASWW